MKQAPRGFIRLTSANGTKTVVRVAAAHITSYWRSETDSHTRLLTVDCVGDDAYLSIAETPEQIDVLLDPQCEDIDL